MRRKVSLFCSLLLASCFAGNSLLAQPHTQPPELNAVHTAAAVAPEIPTPTPYPTLNPEYEDNFQVMNPRSLSGRIAFSANIDGFERVMALDLNSGRVRKVVDGPGNNYYPTWSHDGSQVVFTSDRDGNREIYIANWDGSEQRRLTNNAVADDNATWTPDDKHIVYYSASKPDDDSRANVFMVPAAGGTPLQITHFKGRNTTPRVSPDGTQIAYSTDRYWPGWDVCVWNLVTKQESCPLQGKISYCRAAWSPSGKMLAYSVGALDMIDLGFTTTSEKDRRSLTEMNGKEYDAAWSPSESLIAFTAEADTKGIFNLYVVDMMRKVTPLLKSSYSIRYPSWSGAKTFELEGKRIREQVRREEAERAQRAAEATAAASATAPPAATP